MCNVYIYYNVKIVINVHNTTNNGDDEWRRCTSNLFDIHVILFYATFCLRKCGLKNKKML